MSCRRSTSGCGHRRVSRALSITSAQTTRPATDAGTPRMEQAPVWPRLLPHGHRLAGKLLRSRDGHQLAAREARDEPVLGNRRLVRSVIGVRGPRGNVRTRDRARLAELDELTGIDARRRGDALEGLGNRRGDVIEVNACQLSRERHGELRDVLELRFGKGT